MVLDGSGCWEGDHGVLRVAFLFDLSYANVLLMASLVDKASQESKTVRSSWTPINRCVYESQSFRYFNPATEILILTDHAACGDNCFYLTFLPTPRCHIEQLISRILQEYSPFSIANLCEREPERVSLQSVVGVGSTSSFSTTTHSSSSTFFFPFPNAF